MSKLTRRTVILAKLEDSYGRTSAPDGSCGILVNQGLTLAVSGDKISRDPVRDSLSPLGHVIGSKEVNLDLTVEAKGGGLDSGTLQPPEYEALLLACGLAKTEAVCLPVADSTGFTPGETVLNSGGASGLVLCLGTAGLYVTNPSGTLAEGDNLTGQSSHRSAEISSAPYPVLDYHPVSDPSRMRSATLWFHRDGIMHTVAGCRGSVSLDCSVGRIPTLRFTLRGLFTDPEDAALPTPTLSALTPPVCFGLGLRIGNFTPVATSFQVDLGNDLNSRNDVNAAEGVTEIMITGRSPNGSIDPEADTLAAFNPWNAWKNASTAHIEASVGNTPGNRLRVLVPKALYSETKYSDRNGLVAYDLPFICQGATDDELRLMLS